MFDIGFWELALIAVVGLVIVGPERLPGLLRTAGAWVRRAQRMIAETKAEVSKELDFDGLKKETFSDEHIKDMQTLAKESQHVVREIQKESRLESSESGAKDV